MFKYVPLLLLSGMVFGVIVAAPNRPRDGLTGYEADGTGAVETDRWGPLARLRIDYAISGVGA